MKRHPDNSILSLIFPRTRLASGLGAGIGTLTPPKISGERLPRFLRASPSTALDEFCHSAYCETA